MYRRTAPVVLFLAACGGGSSAVAPAPAPTAALGPLAGEPLASRPGQRACTDGCFAAHDAACERGAQVWRLVLNDRHAALLGTIYLSTTGMVRSEKDGVDRYGVDSETWLSCHDDCGAHGAVCSPFAMDADFTVIKGVDDCVKVEEPGEPWHGHDTVIARMKCNIATFALRYAPGLVAVRDAMLTANMLDDDDPGVDLDGLVVGVRTTSGDWFDMFREITPANCADVRPPAGHETHASLAEYEEFDALWKQIWADRSSMKTEDPSELGAVNDVLTEVSLAACAHYASAD